MIMAGYRLHEQVYVGDLRLLGRVVGSIVYGFGVLTEYRVRLVDGTEVHRQPDQLSPATNVVVLGAPAPGPVRMVSDGPDGGAA